MFLGAALLHLSGAFVLPPTTCMTKAGADSHGTKLFQNTDTNDSSNIDTDSQSTVDVKKEEIISSTELKRELYQLAASFDRGFAATPKARTEANEIGIVGNPDF